MKASYTYVDKNDDFEREPFVVHLHVPSAGERIQSFSFERIP